MSASFFFIFPPDCLSLAASLAANLNAVIGVCRSDHDLIQRGVFVDSFGNRFGFKDVARNQEFYICTVC